ncbi:UNVERIFIED_CONTAM: hypothetical protein GTU68_056327, partial [Idotea baltica]|nr:hypothetical protein [Idotea baltica]
LKGKKYLVLGVANKKSIAWAISTALKEQGAELAFTYVNEAIEKRVRPLAEEIGVTNIYPCDVSKDEEIEKLFASLKEDWGTIDGVVHAVAYAEREDLANSFYLTSKSGFQTAMDVSVYSLIAISKYAKPLMEESGGSIITLSYLGAERVVKNYNVMGVAKAALESSVRYLASDLGNNNIRVNALSAGPIKTLAASGIPHFKQLLAEFAEQSPLKRNVSLEDVAGTALYLLSPLSSGVTAETIYVDCGFNKIAI